MIKNFDSFLNENFIYEEVNADLKDITWTEVGKKFTKNKAEILKLIDKLEWEKIVPGEHIAGVSGSVLKVMVEDLNIPKPDMYAVGMDTFSTEEDPEAAYHIIAVQGHYKNGVARIYGVNGGNDVTIIASILYPNGVEEEITSPFTDDGNIVESEIPLKKYADQLPDWKQVQGVKVKSLAHDTVGYVAIDDMDSNLGSMVFVEKSEGSGEGNTYDVEDLVVVSESEIFEGLLGDIFGGFFKKIKQGILKAIPGGVLKEAEKVLADYEKSKMEFAQKRLKEKEKIYKAKLMAKKDNEFQHKADEIIDRAETAIDAINRAGDTKLERYDEQFTQLTKDKSPLVVDYVNLRIAQVKERISMAELDLAEKFSNEKAVEKLEKIVDKKKADRVKLEKAVEAAVAKKK